MSSFRSCVICNETPLDPIILRNGQSVCKSCVEHAESKKFELNSRIYELEHDVHPLIILMWVAYVIILIVVAILIEISAAFLAGILLLVFVAPISHRLEQNHSRANLSVIAKLNQELQGINKTLESLYSVYWYTPPDWHERRQKVFARANNKCESCGRSSLGSRIPFHVHHVIPRSHADGTHALDNLQLLCEICHSKLPNHALVLASRKKRLYQQRKYGTEDNKNS